MKGIARVAATFVAGIAVVLGTLTIAGVGTASATTEGHCGRQQLCKQVNTTSIMSSDGWCIDSTGIMCLAPGDVTWSVTAADGCIWKIGSSIMGIQNNKPVL